MAELKKVTCECGRSYSARFRECPRCGIKNPGLIPADKKPKHWVLIAGVILLGLLNFLMFDNLNKPSPAEIATMRAADTQRFVEQVEEAENIIQICENTDFRKIEREYVERASKSGDTIWVKKTWHTLAPDDKKTLARNYASCISNSKETKIRDAKTDQVLAEYKVGRGYTDHEQK